jgi:hypothetical protein
MTSVPMRVSGSIQLRNRFGYATHRLVSRQSNGPDRDEVCIFQQYGQVSEDQQQRRRRDVLRRLEKELDWKDTSYMFCTYSQVRVYEGYPKRRHSM